MIRPLCRFCGAPPIADSADACCSRFRIIEEAKAAEAWIADIARTRRPTTAETLTARAAYKAAALVVEGARVEIVREALTRAGLRK